MALIGCIGCCVHPHGRMTIVVMLLAVASFLMLSAAMFSCMFIEINGYLYEKAPFVWPDTVSLDKKSRIGPFSYEKYNIGANPTQEALCSPYSEEQIDELFDGPMKAARAFAVLAQIFIGAAMIGLLILTCSYMELFLVKTFGWLLIFGGFGIAMMFLMCASDFLSDFSGSVWWGATLVVVASICALVAGVLTLRLPESEEQPAEEDLPATKVDRAPKQEQPKERKMPPGTETTTSVLMDDGRTKYVTTKWNKNGTKTVTEMIE